MEEVSKHKHITKLLRARSALWRRKVLTSEGTQFSKACTCATGNTENLCGQPYGKVTGTAEEQMGKEQGEEHFPLTLGLDGAPGRTTLVRIGGMEPWRWLSRRNRETALLEPDGSRVWRWARTKTQGKPWGRSVTDGGGSQGTPLWLRGSERQHCHSKGCLAPWISYPRFTLLLKPCVVFWLKKFILFFFQIL